MESVVPVLHYDPDRKKVARWLIRYLEKGYSLIGLGGFSSSDDFGIGGLERLLDFVFSLLCPKWNNYLPVCRVHGFAMTSPNLMLKYPWWSVDSASWIKSAAYGNIIQEKEERPSQARALHLAQ